MRKNPGLYLLDETSHPYLSNPEIICGLERCLAMPKMGQVLAVAGLMSYSQFLKVWFELFDECVYVFCLHRSDICGSEVAVAVARGSSPLIWFWQAMIDSPMALWSDMAAGWQLSCWLELSLLFSQKAVNAIC